MTDDVLGDLRAGTATLARVWVIERRDGLRLGFTDHDCDLAFMGVTCRAGTGLTAAALQQAGGLSVDNSEAAGLLNDASITEADLSAGRYDGARVGLWLVDWGDPSRHRALFSGTLGEVVRAGAGFRVEMRGLTEPLNQPQGGVYARPCSAVLGDGRCRFDLSRPGYRSECEVERIEDGRILTFSWQGGFDDRWFEGGRLDVLSGAGAGLVASVRADRLLPGGRRVELWEGLRAPVAAGDRIRLTAGCDKRAETCRAKFNNLINFRGFPHLPGEDWLTAPARAEAGRS